MEKGQSLKERALNAVMASIWVSLQESNVLLRCVVIAGCGAILAGCSPVTGFPDDPIDSAVVLSSLTPYFNGSLDAEYNLSNDPSRRRAIRDAIVLNQIRGYDIEFSKFEKSLYGDSNAVSAGGDLVVLTLNGLGATTGGAATKAALSAASAGVVGGQVSISKDLYYQRTIPALLSQIEANRATVKATIVTGLKQSDASYSLAQAYIDLGMLQSAGGLPRAIAGVTQGATTSAQAAEVQLQVASVQPYSTLASSVRIRRWLASDPTGGNGKSLLGWMSTHGVSPILPPFIDSPQLEASRQNAIQSLHIP